MSRLECRSLSPVDVCGAWGVSGLKVEDLEGHCAISLSEPRRVLNGRRGRASMISLVLSYSAPKVWYGVGRPVAVGAGIRPPLVGGRGQYCFCSRPLRIRRARRLDYVHCRARDGVPSTCSPERGGGASRARGRPAGPGRGRQ